MLGMHFPFQIPPAGPNVWILKTILLLAATSLRAMLNLKQQAMSHVLHEEICAEFFFVFHLELLQIRGIKTTDG